jgi:uncharacterized peroxidase-related enzyme
MFLEAPEHDDSVEHFFKTDLEQHGHVTNLSRLWAHRPDVNEEFAALRDLVTEQSTLKTREIAVLVCATASAMGDSYTALTWGKRLSDTTDPSTAAAVMRGSPSARLSTRERALSRWARKVAYMPGATSGNDVEILRGAGLTDREIFEATAFVALRVAFSTVSGALGTNPDRQAYDQAPAELRNAIDFGRPVEDNDDDEPTIPLRRVANQR